MASQTSAPALQVCRNCGGGAPVDAHFCPECSQVLALGRHGDYFRFFGLPRKLCIEPSDLEQRFRALSRQFHPDYFYNASPAERRASLERSSYLNDAFRTLRQKVPRVEYLLGLEGFAAKGTDPGTGTARTPGSAQGSDPVMPAALLEEVFALNEELDEVREMRASGAPAEAWQARLARASAPIAAKKSAHEEQLEELSRRWDALVDKGAEERQRTEVLKALRERVLEHNYINNLLAGIERELAGSGG